MSSVKEASAKQPEKKMMIRLPRSAFKIALFKKLKKTLTERLLTLFESQYLNMQVMGY